MIDLNSNLFSIISQARLIKRPGLPLYQLTNLPLHGHFEFTVVTNRTIVEATLKFRVKIYQEQ